MEHEKETLAPLQFLAYRCLSQEVANPTLVSKLTHPMLKAPVVCLLLPHKGLRRVS